MKRFITLILAISMLMLSACSTGEAITKNPKDSDLELWITDNVKRKDFSEYTEIPGADGGKEYMAPGYLPDSTEYVSYFISAYPDFSDGGEFVTRITVTDPNLKIINGLKCDDQANLWDECLKELGFTNKNITELPDNISFTVWENGVFTVTLTQIGSKCEFVINAQVSNKEDIVVH